jgi:hypothetical protein
VCATAQGHTEAPSFDKSQATELQYHMRAFCANGYMVYGVQEFFMDADGRMYAIGVAYDETEFEELTKETATA